MREREEAERFETMLGEELRGMVEVEPAEGLAGRLRVAVGVEVEAVAANRRGPLWQGWAMGAVAAGVVLAIVWGFREPPTRSTRDALGSAVGRVGGQGPGGVRLAEPNRSFESATQTARPEGGEPRTRRAKRPREVTRSEPAEDVVIPALHVPALRIQPLEMN